MNLKTRGKISFFDNISYGSGNFGYGIITQVVSSYIIFYSTAILAIPGTLIGIAYAISILWDGIFDPWIGRISDNTVSKRFGRRHLYILAGLILSAVFNMLLWIARPEWPLIIKFLWVMLDLIIVKTCIAVYGTPYTALGAELSNDYNERTSIQSVKTIFFLLGLMGATVMGMALFFQPTKLYPKGQLNPSSYINIGITSSAVILIFGLWCYFATKKYIPMLPQAVNADKTEKRSILHYMLSFVSPMKNKSYRYVVIAYLFTNISTALISSLGLHVFTYTFMLGNKSIAMVFGIQLFVSVISQPIWTLISKKIDKKPSAILGLVISLFGTIIFIVLVLLNNNVKGNFLFHIPFALTVGFGTGALFTLPLSMIADTIDIEEFRTGKRTEGVYYGCLTLFYKLSQAIAIFILSTMLDFIKFNSDLKVQPGNTKLALGLVVGIGCIISFGISIFVYMKYDLNKKKILVIQDKLKKKQTELNMNNSVCLE